jgi:hypothetical protein
MCLSCRPDAVDRQRIRHHTLENLRRLVYNMHAAHAAATVNQPREAVMSKGMDSKKDQKKKPEKSLKEKRAAKNEKKKNK